MENKLFKANGDKIRFTITIDVYENCATFSASGSENPTYYELIGALETQKIHVINAQREQNLKELGYTKKRLKK